MTISLVLGSSSFAHAHPTTADTFADAMTVGWTYDNSGLGAPYGKDMATSWYQIFGKNALSMLRDVRYQLTGSDYDNHSGTSLYTYVNNIYSTLTNTSSGSILYGINQTNTKLSDIYNSIGVGGSGNNVLSKLSALINAVVDISIPDLTSYVSNIDTGVNTINTDGVKLTGNALNRLNQIAGYTSWISTIRDTTERIEDINTTLSAISVDTNSKLLSFNNDYNNINWEKLGNAIGVYDSNYNLLSSNSAGKEYYIRYSGTSNNSNIYRAIIPISFNAYNIEDYNFEFGIYRNNQFNPVNTSVIYASQYKSGYTELIYYIPMSFPLNNMFYIHVYSNSNLWFTYNNLSTSYIYAISNENKDYYDVSQFVNESYIIRLFRQAKEMYFDDEALQAKKNNANQTATVLTNFTGPGQASATTNDYGTLSTGVSNVKEGMTTNVNASSAFGIFNNQSGYSFWSNETLQELNSSGSNTRNFSKSNDDDGYVYYDGRLEYLLNAMNGGDKK